MDQRQPPAPATGPLRERSTTLALHHRQPVHEREVLHVRQDAVASDGIGSDVDDSVASDRTGGHSAPSLPPEPFGMRSDVYEFLGAHPAVEDGVAGVWFRVWAPNAREVSVICDRNGWNHGQFALNGSDNGVWWGFYPGVRTGEIYKYSIHTQSGELIEKADPCAFQAELRPRTASVVAQLDGYQWHDEEWLAARGRFNWQEAAVAIYEVHPGSWRRPDDGRDYFTWHELADQLIDYCNSLGYTHIQLMPVSEYPFDGSWGYQVTGYFAPTSRFGTPYEFMEFVDRCHQAGLGVLVDWVPAHFPTDGHGLARFDGTALYEHDDPRRGFHPDWNTLIFNYGRNEVREFLLSSARFWAEKYHVDGIRVDAVASMLYLDYSRDSGQWVPNSHGGRENLDAIAFLRDLNIMLHQRFPGIMSIAEESTAWGGVSKPVYDGGLGFTFKWDMGWMNDTLRYMSREPVHRSHHQHDLSFRMMYAWSENFVLPLSHDEVVHGKGTLIGRMPGDDWQKFANLRLLFGYQYMMPGKKMLFMGGEIGQWSEWNHDHAIDWPLLEFPAHAGIQKLIEDLNHIYRSRTAMFERDCREDGFRWLQCEDSTNSTFAFIRRGHDPADFLVAVFNFTPVPRRGYRVGVPAPSYYREIINTDAEAYGGTNTGNAGGMYSELIPQHGCQHSLCITLPPLAAVVFSPTRVS